MLKRRMVLPLALLFLAASAVFASGVQAQKTVVFLGDSLTSGADWSQLFHNVKVINKGIPGDTTKRILSRLDKVIALRPQKVFLMAGINDLGRGAKTPDIASNYQRIVEQIITRSPGTIVFVLSVLPVNNRQYRVGVSNSAVRDLNSRLTWVAANTGQVYIDLASRMSTTDGQLNPSYTVDGVHLNVKAYRVWGSYIEGWVYSH